MSTAKNVFWICVSTAGIVTMLFILGVWNPLA